MALDTAVDEAKWVLQSDGSEPQIITSASSYEVVTMTRQVDATEYKYFCLDLATAQAYKAANPTLRLTIEVITNMPNACNLIKRTETNALVSVSGSARPT
jgi:hypothetical protein